MIIRAFIVIPIILILLYLVINYFFVKSTTLTKLQSAKETQIIKASTIPNNHNTNNYAYSMWFYVDDWDYRLGEPKVLLSRGNSCDKDSSCDTNNCIDGVCVKPRRCYKTKDCEGSKGKDWYCHNEWCYQKCYSNDDPHHANGTCLWNNGNIPTGKQCNRHKDSDCESNNCLNGVCATPRKCDSSPQCVKHVGKDWYCSNGLCYQSCYSNNDPRNDKGVCIWNKGNIPTGKQCNRHKDSDCESNNCIDGVCASRRICTSGAQCWNRIGAGWWCYKKSDSKTGMCIQGCNSNEDPRNSEGVCLWNNGNIPTGKQCNRQKDSDCDSNNCLNGVCANPRKCDSSPQCVKHVGAGWRCNKKNDSKTGTCLQECNSNEDPRNNEGECLWNKGNIPNRKQCNRHRNNDCESNNCINGICWDKKNTEYTPIGCYHDRPSRALPKQLGNTGTKTDFAHAGKICAKKANDKGYKYFGLQWPPGNTQCWVGNDLTHAKKYGKTECGLGGAAWKNFIYSTPMKPATSNVYAVNKANEIYAKNPRGSEENWYQPNPSAHLNNVSATGKTHIWGVGSDHQIWKCKRPCLTGDWKSVPGALKQISADDQYVYGVTPNDSIWRRNEDGTGAWVRIPGGLKNITASGKDYIWGVNNNDAIYRCRKPCVTGKWTRVSGGLKQVAADDKYVWGVNNGDVIWKKPVDGSGSWDSSASKQGGRLFWVSPSAPNYVWGVGLDRRLWYCKKPCTDGKWTTQGAFSNAIQVEGDSTGTGGKYSTIPTEMWLLEPAVFRSGASVLKPNKRLQTWWIDKQFKYDLYGNMIHKQFLQAVNKIAPMVGASASVKVHSGGNNSNGSTLKIIRIGENTVRAELGGYSFISYYKHKCPSAFPYPVETGAYVNAGLCYNKKQYAQRGSGVWGSWCAWNPEDPNIKNQVSAEGKWAKCKDVVNAKLAKCPSAYPYPVEKGAYVNAKLCYNKQQYAHQGWGAANSWCAWNPEDPSIKNQLPVYGKPCKDVVNTESFTTMTTQSASDTDPSSYTSFIENAPSPSIVFDAMDNDIIISVTCYPSDDANNKKPILHKCTVKNFPLQSWVNLAISLYGRTLDIYIDGKLARTCNLPGIVKADPNADVLVTPLGGFGGYTTDIQYWDTAINPEQAYNIYRQGLDESVLGELFDKYRVKVSLLEDNKVQGSVEI